ncbi:MAG: Hpt domain-containing protein [Planctomycetaceae bacterium]|nr:Hpt domain-containing protein [Planctomycetaceae bacterium]
MMSEPQRSPFNRQTALQRIGGDERLLHDLAAFYVVDAPVLLSQLKDAVPQGDAEAVMHAAHTLKSLSANFDAHQAVALAGVMERAGRSGDLTVATDLVSELEAAVAAVIGSLQAAYHDLV